MIIADEIDAPYLGDRTLVDFEHQVDAVLRQFDDLRIDRRGKSPAAAIKLQETPHVALRLGAGENLARLFLHLLTQRVVAELVIALEHDAIDHWILDDLDDERVAGAAQTDVAEQAGIEQGLQRAVDAIRIERIARLDRHVRLHCFRLDTLRALDPDLGDRASRRNLRVAQRRQGDRDGRRTGDCGAHRDDSPLKTQYYPPPSILGSSVRSVRSPVP